MNHKNVVIVLFLALTGCGGGGTDHTTSPSTATATEPGVLTAAVATMQLTALPDNKLPWNKTTAMTITLKDGNGALVPSVAVTCSATDAIALTVAADCSSIKGNRLGMQQITVSGRGNSATVALKTIPQRQAFANHGVDDQGDYTLLVTPAGNVLAWGSNQSGVLGQGVNAAHLASSALPLLVKDASGIGVLANIVAASAGGRNAMALNEDGAVLVWGDGSNLSSSDGAPYLPQNAVKDSSLKHIVQIAVGATNAVALADDGTVYSWGAYTGQGSRAALPGQVKNAAGNGILTNIVAVSAGWNHTLALTDEGKVFEWGYQSGGQVGLDPESLPALVKRASDNTELSNIVAIADGHTFSLALTSEAKIYAWGQNNQGQIGQDLMNDQYWGAVLVTGLTCGCTLNNISMISAGGNHALALDTSGHVYSWGLGSSGELGDGINRSAGSHALLPIQVATSLGQLDGIVSLSAGYAHSLALRQDGSVLIWGAGMAGDLGQGDANVSDSPLPTPVNNSLGTGSLELIPMASYPNLSERGR